MPTFNVNNDALIAMTAKLDKLGKDALPNAVRGTLNSLAFDMKKRTLPKSADEAFENRSKNFFKAFSRVETAKGRDINTMQSVVGMGRQGVKSTQAIEDLEQQERGGTIKGRSYIPLDTARTGKSSSRMVAQKNRIKKMRLANVIEARNVKAETKKQRFIKAAFKSKKLFGNESYVLGNKHDGGQTLSRIDEIKSVNGKVQIKRTPLYTYISGRTVAVQQTKFRQRAAHETGLNIDRIWLIEGRREFKRVANK